MAKTITLPVTQKKMDLPDLTRKQMKSLVKDGLFEKADREKASEAEDKLLEMAFPGRSEEIDKLPNRDATMLVRELIKYTYGNDEDEKNS